MLVQEGTSPPFPHRGTGRECSDGYGAWVDEREIGVIARDLVKLHLFPYRYGIIIFQNEMQSFGNILILKSDKPSI